MTRDKETALLANRIRCFEFINSALELGFNKSNNSEKKAKIYSLQTVLRDKLAKITKEQNFFSGQNNAIKKRIDEDIKILLCQVERILSDNGKPRFTTTSFLSPSYEAAAPTLSRAWCLLSNIDYVFPLEHDIEEDGDLIYRGEGSDEHAEKISSKLSKLRELVLHKGKKEIAECDVGIGRSLQTYSDYPTIKECSFEKLLSLRPFCISGVLNDQRLVMSGLEKYKSDRELISLNENLMYILYKSGIEGTDIGSESLSVNKNYVYILKQLIEILNNANTCARLVSPPSRQAVFYENYLAILKKLENHLEKFPDLKALLNGSTLKNLDANSKGSYKTSLFIMPSGVESDCLDKNISSANDNSPF